MVSRKLANKGQHQRKGSTASFEIMLCDLDIQPESLGNCEGSKIWVLCPQMNLPTWEFSWVKDGRRTIQIIRFLAAYFWQTKNNACMYIYMFFFCVCMCVSHICHLLDIFPTNHCLQAVYRWFLSEELDVTIAPNRTKPIRVLWWHPTNYHYIYHSHKSESHTAWNTLACLIFWQGSCSSILLFIDCHI